MFIPPICPSCGMAIGDIGELFVSIRAGLLAAKLAGSRVKPSQVAHDPMTQVPLNDVLIELGIPPDAECCRQVLLSAMDIRDVY